MVDHGLIAARHTLESDILHFEAAFPKAGLQLDGWGRISCGGQAAGACPLCLRRRLFVLTAAGEQDDSQGDRQYQASHEPSPPFPRAAVALRRPGYHISCAWRFNSEPPWTSPKPAETG